MNITNDVTKKGEPTGYQLPYGKYTIAAYHSRFDTVRWMVFDGDINRYIAASLDEAKAYASAGRPPMADILLDFVY